MIVDLHDAASAELDDAAAWYEGQREGLGHSFAREIMAAAAARLDRRHQAAAEAGATDLDVGGDPRPHPRP